MKRVFIVYANRP